MWDGKWIDQRLLRRKVRHWQSPVSLADWQPTKTLKRWWNKRKRKRITRTVTNQKSKDDLWQGSQSTVCKRLHEKRAQGTSEDANSWHVLARKTETYQEVSRQASKMIVFENVLWSDEPKMNLDQSRKKKATASRNTGFVQEFKHHLWWTRWH